MTERRRPEVRRVAVVLAAAALTAACSAGGRNAPAPPVSSPSRPFIGVIQTTPSSHHVQLNVVTESKKTLDIFYDIGAGNENHRHVQATSPWTVDVVAPGNIPLVSIAVSVDERVPVTCVIVLDDKIVQQSTNFGAVGCHHVLD